MHLIPADIQKKLMAPFPAAEVEWRPGKVVQKEGRPPAALAMAYIDARAVANRLDSVVGIDRWQSEHLPMGDKQIGARIGILFDTGWIYKSDGTYVGNLESSGKIDSKEEGRLEMEAKGSFSVAFKRAAVHWGIGRYLYDIGATWAEVEQRGQSWAFSRAGLAKLDAIADKLFREANRGQAGQMPAYEPPDDAPPAAQRQEPSPERRPAERQPEQRPAAPASSGSPTLDLFDAILAENASGKGSPTRIRDAGLPPDLRRQAMADLLGRVIPLQARHDDLCTWMEWIFAEIPKDTSERDALRVALAPVAEKLGWTIATHNAWREAQKRLREQRAA